jgi:hypothetical protein
MAEEQKARKSMYDYSQEFMQVADLLESGEWSEELDEILKTIESEGDDKFESCFYACRNLQFTKDQLKAKASLLQEEVDRINRISKRVDGNMKRIESSMEAYMRIKKLKKYKKGVVDVIMRAGKDFVYDEKAIPEDYFIKEEKVKLDLKGFQAYVKENPDYAKEELGAYYLPKTTFQLKLK